MVAIVDPDPTAGLSCLRRSLGSMGYWPRPRANPPALQRRPAARLQYQRPILDVPACVTRTAFLSRLARPIGRNPSRFAAAPRNIRAPGHASPPQHRRSTLPVKVQLSTAFHGRSRTQTAPSRGGNKSARPPHAGSAARQPKDQEEK